MKLRLDEIKKPVASEMKIFEGRFEQHMKSSVPLLDRITHYIVSRKGKQMRPMFVFLSAGANGGINDSTYRGAALIELLHTATLVHDDVVDDSNLRRGFFSISALWKNKIAVLVGDYLLSKGLLLSIDNDDFQMLHIVSEAVRRMSEGELLQLETARKLNIAEDTYYEIIRNKTASLIASCCACGTASTGASKEQIKLMHDFGEVAGMAFQIKDDLFDFGTDEKIGKPAGIDIQESQMTLPVIYAMNQASRSEKRRILNIIKNHHKDKQKTEEVIRFVQEQGGIRYAMEKMISFRDKAYEFLKLLPPSEYTESLKNLVTFTIEREH